MTERTVRNLTGNAQFKVFHPDVVLEDIKGKQAPWIMRLDLQIPYQQLGVVEIDVPSVVAFGLGPPKKLTAYAYMYMFPTVAVQPVFITSLFAGTDIPWTAPGPLGRDDLVCCPLGVSVHVGIPLIHIGVSFGLHSASVERADVLEKELVDMGYMVFKAKEYDLDKKLIAMTGAHAFEAVEKQVPGR